MIPLAQQSTARRARVASYWGPAMTESQYAVFHFDVKTMSMREGEGVPLIFDSLAAAERYSQAQIAATPELGCRIYDRGGKIAGTYIDAQVYERFHGQPAAKSSLLAGMACLIAGVGVDQSGCYAGVPLDFRGFSWRALPVGGSGEVNRRSHRSEASEAQ